MIAPRSTALIAGLLVAGCATVPPPAPVAPRTVVAASIAQERGIARCVLLANPDKVAEVAKKQGVTLPASIEIIDPALVADGARQVPGAKIGLTHATGGGLSGFDHGACSIHILAR